MHIHISTQDGVPIYLQIVRQIKHQVASGILAPGQELPSIRELAQTLLVNPNTIARAYRELETAGLVEKRRTAGTFVTEGSSPLARREKLRVLAERLDSLLAEAHQMQVPLEDLVELLHQRARVLAKKPSMQNPEDNAQ